MTSLFGTRSSILALDLSATGAPAEWQRDRDPDTESFIMARLAGLATLLDKAGTDLIAVDAPFRLGGRRRRDDWLDGAVALSRLGRHTANVRFAASMPVGAGPASSVSRAVSSLHRATASRGGWQVDSCADQQANANSVDAVVAGLSNAGVREETTIVAQVRSDVDIEIAAARANVTRIRTGTVEEARQLRSQIRAAAKDWGRESDEVKVLVDLHAILDADEQQAAHRAEFLTEIGLEVPEIPLRHVGTVEALASLWQNWVRAGAADGFTIIPGSIPTDVIRVATKLVPELEQRGLRTPALTAISHSAPKAATRRTVIAA